MNYLLLIALLALIVVVYFRSRGQARETLRKGEEEILKEDLDGFVGRRQTFNRMQQPGDLGDSVEKNSYPKSKHKKGGAE